MTLAYHNAADQDCDRLAGTRSPIAPMSVSQSRLSTRVNGYVAVRCGRRGFVP